MATRVQIINVLEELMPKEPDLMEAIIQDYVLNIDHKKFAELEEFITHFQ